MDLKTYKKILNSQYSSLASWAVWALPDDNGKKSNINDMSIFNDDNRDKLLETLNPHYIIVGFNVSRDDEHRKDGYKGPWANFHSDSPYQKDFKLRDALKGTKAWGGYLTDIIKNYPNVNSDNVIKMLKDASYIEEKCIDMFREEIALLGDSDPTIIALGGKSFEILTKNLGGEYRIAKVPHYSCYMNKEDYREEVAKVLERCK